jgi:hypothetical protein
MRELNKYQSILHCFNGILFDVQVTEAKTETRRKSSIIKTDEKVCKQNSLKKRTVLTTFWGYFMYILYCDMTLKSRNSGVGVRRPLYGSVNTA